MRRARRTVNAQGLRIDFPDGRSLMFDLSGSSGEAAVAIVAQHNDPAMRAKLALQPEHYDSVTLHVGASPPREDDAEDALREPGSTCPCNTVTKSRATCARRCPSAS